MLHYSLFSWNLYGVRCLTSRRMILDRVRRKKLRLGILIVALCVIYVLMYKSELESIDQKPHHKDNIKHIQKGTSRNARISNSTRMLNLTSTSNQRLFYTSPNYPALKGKPFAVSESSLRELRLFSKDYVNLTDDVLKQFVFVTAASFAFFDMMKETVCTIQKFRPQNQIEVYDLGLTEMQAHEVQSLCGVKYRKFGFSIYPKHVNKKFFYAWKPLILADSLSRHPGVFWLDSSVRIITDDFSALLQQVKKAGGALSLTTTGHSTYATTDPKMYDYLPPGDPTALKREEQREATLLIYKTESIMNQIVKWMILCALDVNCIAPLGSRRGCIWKSNDHFKQYAQCHRFDQSAFNILMSNYVKGKSSSAYYASSRVCKIERFANGNGIPKYCGGDKSKDDLLIRNEDE